MCGIGGIRRYGPEPITEDQIRVLLCCLERRGNHATGIAIMNGAEISVFKDDEPAWNFVTSKGFEKFLKENLRETTETVLLHTRWATQGSPSKNENNHPVYAGESAIVHNGGISNEVWLYKDLKLDRKAEVDSDIIRAIVDAKGITQEAIRTLNRMAGSAAIAAVHPKFPGKLLLARSGSPLVLASTPNQLMWASEKQALHTALRPYIKRFGMVFQPNRTDGVGYITMNNDSAYIFGPDGLEWHDKFSTSSYYRTPDYSSLNTGYRGSRRRHGFKDSQHLLPAANDPDVVMCRNPECNSSMTIPDNLKSSPLYELICTDCKTTLAEKPTTAK